MSRPRNLLEESLAAIERLQGKLDAAERASRTPIAIVGAGCRYPGGIDTPEGLWRVVRDGVDAVREVPRDRWDIDAYYDADANAPGKMVTRRGGFLDQVDQFDPQYFGISPREAATLDPQQRLLLETAVEALESAGIATDRLAGSATGVFVGITTSDYGQVLRAGGPENSDVYSATGAALNAAAGRISFTFGLQGPCVALDTACASSLVAVHQACQSLRTGESDLALAGGVNVVLSPDAMVLFSKWGMMAPDGACKTFDAAADGFVRAEGCAVIALKRLSDAQAAGDPILAVIRGSAVNSDGRSSGLTVPNGPAQEAVIRKALAASDLAPADIDYVEAHGTGTPLGDPIEVEALGAVMRQGRAADRPLMIGSIKTNLGHTEAASGLAGLLKTVMALRHEAIPPHLHFTAPNPGIPWSDLPIAVPTKLTPWTRGARVRRAGVSSFGFSGTNAHVVLEEAPLAAALPEPAGTFPVPLSARDDAGLRALALRTADAIAAEPALRVADVATTMALGRAALARRAAVVAQSRGELEQALRGLAAGELAAPAGTVRPGERARIAFLFTGQGAQYAGMGRGLYESEPVFRAVIDRAAAFLAPLRDKPLLDVLFKGDSINETGYTQPALYALEVALAELWRSWGIVPSIVAGHSVGEYAAACVAGVFGFEEGLALIAERGRLMQSLPAGGAMAAVFAGEARVAALIAGRADRLAIAALNGPEETVVSGDADALADVLARAAGEGIKGRALEVSHAFHSPRLDPMLDALEARAAQVKASSPRIPLVSNLTGRPFAAGEAPDARYWRRHAREPVRFAACVESLRAARVGVLLEVGPHPTLLALAARAAPGESWTSVASLRRDRDEAREIRSAAGVLWARGASLDWAPLTSARGGRRVALPTYPFQRERYWVDAPSAKVAPAPAVTGHPLLGEGRESAASPGTWTWERDLSLPTHPWLTDHRVQGAAIVPATAYIEMALAAAREAMGPGSLRVGRIENLKPIILRDGDVRRVQATLVVASNGEARFSVHGRNAGGQWIAHVSATIARTGAPAPGSGLPALEVARAKVGASLPGSRFYGALADKGNQWGPRFQGMDEVWIGEGEAVARVRVPEALVAETPRYRFHPAVSDACGHCLVATIPMERSEGATGGAFVGGGVREIRFHRSPAGGTLWAHARLKRSEGGDSRDVLGDVFVYDEDGALVSETLDARLRFLDEASGGALLGAPADWFYEMRWREQALAAPATRGAAEGTWIVLADRGGIGERIAARRAASGRRTVLVTRGDRWQLANDRAVMRLDADEDYRHLLAAAGAPSAIVHLWNADAAGATPPADAIEGALRSGPECVVRLLHAIGARPGTARPRLWLATRASHAVAEGDRCEAPWNAPLWGLGRALSAENAALWGGLVDVGEGDDAEGAAAMIGAEVEQAGVEDLVALRRGRRHVARLERRTPSATRVDFAARAGATYLVTGGLGGIGLAMARWLVERGARELLLVGRTPVPPRDAWKGLDSASAPGRRVAAILALEAAGARVETSAMDVASPGAIVACLDARRKRGAPELAGVIHAAGVLQFESLDTQDPASMRAGLVAKIEGAWRLHEISGRAPLDFFVMCSSTSALLASPLLGGYAAGNAFLDALAHHRRARGLAALSVNWGTWGEVGMAVEAGRSASGAMLAGFSTMPTARALAAMQELLSSQAVQSAVMPVDWARASAAYPAFAADPFLRSLVTEAASIDARDSTQGTLTAAALRAATPAERQERLRDYLRLRVAQTLGMKVERLEPSTPLSTMGFDSLMAVQLKNRIEADLAIAVPMIRFLQGPSVDELVPAMAEALASAGEPPAPTEPKEEETWEAGSV